MRGERREDGGESSVQWEELATGASRRQTRERKPVTSQWKEVEFQTPPSRRQKLEQVVLGEREERGGLAAAFAVDLLLAEAPVTNGGNAVSAIGDFDGEFRRLAVVHVCTPEEDRDLETGRILLRRTCVPIRVVGATGCRVWSWQNCATVHSNGKGGIPKLVEKGRVPELRIVVVAIGELRRNVSYS